MIIKGVKPMNSANTIKTTLIIVIVAAVGLFGGSWLSQKIFSTPGIQNEVQSGVDGISATTFPTPRPLKAFSLHDQFGKPFGLEQFKGKWSYVFFGYTNCPDVCPTTLHMMNGVYDDLIAKGLTDDQFQVVFVSVDPDRDDNAQLGEYMKYFNPHFLGVTGVKEQIDILSKQLSAIYFVTKPKFDRPYQVNHSAAIALVDPEVRFHAIFTPPHDPQKLVHDLIALRARD